MAIGVLAYDYALLTLPGSSFELPYCHFYYIIILYICQDLFNNSEILTKNNFTSRRFAEYFPFNICQHQIAIQRSESQTIVFRCTVYRSCALPVRANIICSVAFVPINGNFAASYNGRILFEIRTHCLQYRFIQKAIFK